jgi:putative membrane protein
VNLSDPDVVDRIEKAVGEAEKATSAEIVVVIAPQSRSYLDREMVFGVAVGLIALAFLVFSPWNFHPALAFVDFLLGFGIGTLACNRIGPLKRLVVGRRRMEKNLHDGAAISYLDEGVGATRDRTGILLYVSLFERMIRILPDFGVEGKVGEAPWNRLLAEVGRPEPARLADGVVELIEKAGKILGEALPPGEENPDEIPNAPRILK